jgi:hypothetical protein
VLHMSSARVKVATRLSAKCASWPMYQSVAEP